MSIIGAIQRGERRCRRDVPVALWQVLPLSEARANEDANGANYRENARIEKHIRIIREFSGNFRGIRVPECSRLAGEVSAGLASTNENTEKAKCTRMRTDRR